MCQKTEESQNLKICEAVQNGQLVYKEPFYFSPGMKIKDAFEKLVSTKAKFAVVKQYDQELGMVSEAAIREFFRIFPADEETKNEDFARMQLQLQ